MFKNFKDRSSELERIDTGDYTPAEYERFLTEIAFINRYLGDGRALRKTLLRKIADDDTREFSVLDVGSGSGEILRIVADFARRTGRKAFLTGLDLSEISPPIARAASAKYAEISSIRGDAFRLPFEDGAFDHVISSLFFHHLTDAQIPAVTAEMLRVSRCGIVVIDLDRNPIAWVLYRMFCKAFRISPLVTEDGSLSIKRGFTREEMLAIGKTAGVDHLIVEKHAPFRVVMRASG